MRYLLILLATSLLPTAAIARADAPDARPSGSAKVSLETQLRLEALGYAEHSVDDPDPSRRGVTRNDAAALPGVNYYCTGSVVRFVGMDGTVLHETKLEIGASPGSGCLAQLYGDAAVVAVASPLLSMSRLASQPRWLKLGPYHHDVGIDPSGLLYALRKQSGFLARAGRSVPIMSQSVDVLDPKGRLIRTIDLAPLLGTFVSDARLQGIVDLAARGAAVPPEDYQRAIDVFHPNTIEIVDWPHSPGGGRRALLALRQLDRVVVVDLDERRLVWEWGAQDLIGPHDPWLLPGGNVLVFDNGARPHDDDDRTLRPSSRVVEMDPRSGKIVWQYRADPPEQFFSPTRGGAQPLANGNVLITESTKGHVFEVTRAGDVVWEFWNTDFDRGARRTIYRMRRIGLDEYRALRGIR